MAEEEEEEEARARSGRCVYIFFSFFILSFLKENLLIIIRCGVAHRKYRGVHLPSAVAANAQGASANKGLPTYLPPELTSSS